MLDKVFNFSFDELGGLLLHEAQIHKSFEDGRND